MTTFHQSASPRGSDALSAPGRDGLPEAFQVDARPDRGRVIVAPHGELDLATVDRLRESVDGLVASGFGLVVLDLRGLSFMDSTGLSFIVEQARRDDATVEVIDGTPAVARLFDLTGLRGELPFVQPRELG